MRDYETETATRNAKVLAAAVAEALEVGYTKFTRESVAARAGVSPGTVSNFAPMPALRDAVVQQAIDTPVLPVLVQALADGHPLARAAPEDLRARALASALAQ